MLDVDPETFAREVHPLEVGDGPLVLDDEDEPLRPTNWQGHPISQAAGCTVWREITNGSRAGGADRAPM